MAVRRYRRKPVTYEQFNTAVDSLMKANGGAVPTYDQIVEELDGGSFTTIGRYLDRRFPLAPVPVIARDSLAADVARMVAAALEKQRSEDLKIIGWQEDNKDSLLRESGAMEDELAQAYSELEQVQARIGEMHAENQVLQQLHQNERAANEQKLLELAKAAVRVEDCKDLRVQADNLIAQMAVLKANLEEALTGRQNESQRAGELEEQLQQAREELFGMSRELVKLRSAGQAS